MESNSSSIIRSSIESIEATSHMPEDDIILTIRQARDLLKKDDKTKLWPDIRSNPNILVHLPMTKLFTAHPLIGLK